MTKACVSLVADPAWGVGFDEIWDFTQSGEVDVSPTDLDELVATTHENATRIGAGRCVFVHTRDSIEALLRLFEWRTANLARTYHTTRTRAEALDWLGLSPAALADVTSGD